MRVVLHVGLHKTGTSALQTFLFKNEKQLLEHGFYYRPTIPSAFPNHNPLAAAFKNGQAGNVGETILADMLAAAGDIEAARGAPVTVLISAEMLCSLEMNVCRLMEALRGHEVTAIAYLRHPCDMLISAFNERVRHFPSHYDQPINQPPYAYGPSYAERLKGWMNRSDLTLTFAPYDRKQWTGGSIFADFLTMLGLPTTGFDMEDMRVNKSISHAAAEQLRQLYALNATEDEHRALLEKLRADDLADEAYPLTAETVEACLSTMRETLPALRPFLRPGFCEKYLLERRPIKKSRLTRNWHALGTVVSRWGRRIADTLFQKPARCCRSDRGTHDAHRGAYRSPQDRLQRTSDLSS